MACGCTPLIPCSSCLSTTTCGCPLQLSSECIFYQGSDLNCISVVNGMTLEESFAALNSIVCTLNPSGVMLYDVVSANPAHITELTTVVGNTTTFTLDLAPSFVSTVNNSVTNINSIFDTLSDLPITISTTTPLFIDVVHPSPNVWNVNYIGTPTIVQGGVIYSNCTPATRPVTTANATTKSFSANYLTSYNLIPGDLIKIRTTFQTPSLGDLLAFPTTALNLDSYFTISTRDNTIPPLFNPMAVSYIYDVEVNVISTGYPTSGGAPNALVTAKVYKTIGNSATRYYPENTTSGSEILAAHTLSEYVAINWASLNIYCQQTGSTVSVSAKNDLLRVELVKKI
jgi:hypothetical protein